MVDDILEYAKRNNVPIMESDSISYIQKFIKDNNIKNILEVGTAIGYSAILMASVGSDILIDTIERDEERFSVAEKNIKKLDLERQINIIYSDALLVELDKKYDLILIDASKAQNEKFFKKFSGNLKSHGFVITDNISFHGMVEKDISEIESRNVRGLVRKIRKYKEFLLNNEEFQTVFLEIGDTLAVSRRKV